MGVPGFFLWLLKKYKNDPFLLEKVPQNVQHLFFDTNCLIHPKCFEVLAENENWTDLDSLHHLMLNKVEEYIDQIINLVNPEKSIMISIDGPVPMAKIKQQRHRRFRSYHDNKMRESIMKKHKKQIPKHWSNSAITPGTKFMKLLDKRINNYIVSLNDRFPEVIFSSSEEPGEGEHKIMDRLREINSGESVANSVATSVVYGLDADLIFLSMGFSSIYLLREDIRNKGFQYIDIDLIKDCLISEVGTVNIVDDIIFLSSFLGNDFLPHHPSFSIYPIQKSLGCGLDLLIESYKSCYKSYPEIQIVNRKNDSVRIDSVRNDSIRINYNDLIKVLKLVVMEENSSTLLLRKYKLNRFVRKDGTMESELDRIENMCISYTNSVELGKDTEELWKFRYYQHYFYETDHMDEMIKDICYQYMVGLEWIAHYYFVGCVSWNWLYRFNQAPFLSDFLKYLENQIQSNDEGSNDSIKIEFKLGKPVDSTTQLLMVLPPQSFYLLPEHLQNFYRDPRVRHLYPMEFSLDYLYKRKYFMCIPSIPNPDLLIQEIKNNHYCNE